MNTEMTWILLRGLTRESGHWGEFAQQFAQVVPKAQVIALDLPGNGQFHLERSPLSVQAMVAHCRAELALRHVAPPYGLLAMSLGAMAAVEWSKVYPQEVAAQVLINTSMRPFSAFYQRLRPGNYGVLLKLVLLGASPQLWEHTVLRLTSHKADTSVLGMWLEIRRAQPVSRSNALRQLLAAARFKAPGNRPLVPTLVLASQQDRLVAVQCSEALAKHWQCALHVHASAGHDLPLDDGPWVARQVQQWLLQLS
jgi:pimeloyl-ACP methyl ester carboxylesterase